ncbi:MAG: hypothetical protein C6P35_17120 [Cohnella sp.]|nr:MAG: hypothetical protein C6P35_17120 [Cohnella sp.]
MNFRDFFRFIARRETLIGSIGRAQKGRHLRRNAHQAGFDKKMNLLKPAAKAGFLEVHLE